MTIVQYTTEQENICITLLLCCMLLSFFKKTVSTSCNLLFFFTNMFSKYKIHEFSMIYILGHL